MFSARLKDVAKLAYYAIPESDKTKLYTLKKTIITKLDPPEKRLTSAQIKQKLSQIEPQDKEVGLKFMLRIEAAFEKFKELNDWTPTESEIYDLLINILGKTVVGRPKRKEARDIDG